MKKLEFITALLLTANWIFFIAAASVMFCTEYGVVGPLLLMVFGCIGAVLIACFFTFAAFIRMLLDSNKPVV